MTGPGGAAYEVIRTRRVSRNMSAEPVDPEWAPFCSRRCKIQDFYFRNHWNWINKKLRIQISFQITI